MNLQVAVEHFEDRSEPSEDGTFEYVYVYDIYAFTGGDRSLSARRYADEPSVASLQCTWPELAQSFDLVGAVISHLKSIGVDTIKMIDPGRGGYSDLYIAAEYARRLGYITAEQSAYLKSLTRGSP